MAERIGLNALARMLQALYIDPFSDPILEQRDLASRIETFASWSKAVFYITVIVTLGAIFWWLDSGSSMAFKVSLYSARIIVSSSAAFCSQRGCAVKNARLSTACCVLAVTLTFILLSLENPEVLVSQKYLLGTPEEDAAVALRGLKDRWSKDDFESFMSGLMQFVRNASDAGQDVYPISCAATVANMVDSTIPTWQGGLVPIACKKRSDFSYNFMLGQAYLLGVAALSGLTSMSCMLSWLLCQAWALCLFYTHCVSMQLWLQNHVLLLVASFFASLFTSNYMEKRRRACTLLSFDCSLVSLSPCAIKARQKWIQKLCNSRVWANTVAPAVRPAISVDAFALVGLSKDSSPFDDDQLAQPVQTKRKPYEVLPPCTPVMRRAHSAPCMVGGDDCQ